MPASVPRIVVAVPTVPTPSETWVHHHLRMIRASGFAPLLLVASDLAPVPPEVAELVDASALVPPCPSSWPSRAAFVLRQLAARNGHGPALARTLNAFLFRRRLTSLVFPRWAVALRQLGPFALAHGHYLFTAEILGALRRCGFLRTPVIGTTHGIDLLDWPQHQAPGVFPGFLSELDVVTCGSHFMLERFTAEKIPGPRLRRIPLGIDATRFPAERPPRAPGPLRVLSVARLVPFKGIDVGLRAFARLVATVPDARYIVAGGGPERANLEALAAQLGIADRVEFLGTRKSSDVLELFREADIFLFPSLTADNGECEGQGLALLEAQSAGLPVVAARSGGIPENFLPDESGFAVDERDVVATAAALERLARDPALRVAFGRRGREFVERQRSLENTRAQFGALYRELLGVDGAN